MQKRIIKKVREVETQMKNKIWKIGKIDNYDNFIENLRKKTNTKAKKIDFNKNILDKNNLTFFLL